MAAPKPVVPLLNFDIENKPRQVVAIDGRHYPIRRSDDVTIDQSRALGVKLKIYGQINIIAERKGANLNRTIKAQLDQVMKDLCRIILDAPPAILKKLTPVMRFRIINVFLTLSLTSQLSAAKASELSGRISDQALDAVLSGRTSSRNSAGSSVGIRSRGGRGTRSRSSGSISQS